MRSIRMVFAAALACSSPAALAHTMWLNLVPEPIEQHLITSIAYGDFMPGSELLTPDWGNMTVVTYELVSPGDGRRHSLGVPQLSAAPRQALGTGLTVQPAADTGVRKIAFAPDAKKGTYLVAAQSPVFQYITYRNSKGERHDSDQPYAQLKDVRSVDGVARDVFFMKALHVVGGWTDPPPLGHVFEIVPLSDLSQLQVGGRARFKVLLNGAAWTAPSGTGRLLAYNAAFGDRWGLDSGLKYGEGEFRIPAAGLWRVDAYFEARSADFPELVASSTRVPGVTSEDVPLHLYTSLVFNVRP